MKSTIFTYLILLVLSQNAYSQGVESLEKTGGAGYDVGLEMVTDASDNSIRVGNFTGTENFGGISLTSATGGEAFIAKYNSTGTALWAKKIDQVHPVDLKIDNQNNVYIASRKIGISANPLNLGPNCTIAGYNGFYVAKFDANGNCQWAVGPSFGNAEVHAIDVDASGNVYVTGLVYGGTTIAGTTFTTNGGQDLLVMKISPTGSVVYAKNYGGSGDDVGRDIWVDDNGKMFVTGNIRNCTNFGGQVLTVNGINDFLLAGFNASTGNVDWAYNNGSADYSYGFSMEGDNLGNIYVTGTYTFAPIFGNTSFDENNRFFLAKFSDSGNILWSKMADASSSWTQPHNQGAASQWSGNKMLLDQNSGVLYLTFQSSGSGNFGSDILNNGSLGVYVVKYDLNGNPIWAQQSNGGENKCNGISKLSNGNIRLFGSFESQMEMGWETINTANSNDDRFLAELFDCPIGSASITRKKDTLFASPGLSYQWYQDGIELSGQTGEYYIALWDASFSVTITDNGFCSYTSEEYIFESCPFEYFNILQGGDTLFAGDGISFQWLDNNAQEILGETGSYFVPGVTGYFSVELVDSNYCDRTSNTYEYILGSVAIKTIKNNSSIKLFPNPSNDFVQIQKDKNSKIEYIEMYDLIGNKVKTFKLEEQEERLNVKDIAKGVYILSIKTDKKIFNEKLVIE